MSYLKLNYLLFKLKTSNDYLLEFYYRLFYDVRGPEARKKKMILSSRIALRENFKQEHLKFMKEDISENILFTPFTGFLRMENDLKKRFQRIEWSSCEILEKENLKVYNQILNIRDESVLFRKMLSNQKFQIEEYLINNAIHLKSVSATIPRKKAESLNDLSI